MRSFAYIMNIPSPYRIPVITEFYRQLTNAGIEFQMHFMSDFKKGHKSRPKSWHNPKMEFPYTYWPDYGIGDYHFNPGLIRHLRRFQPDYLMMGSPYDTFTGIFSAWLCPARIARCCNTEANMKTPGKMKGFIGWLKRAVYSKYEYIDLPGADSIRHIHYHQSFTRRKMPTPIILPNLVDESRFKPRSEWPAGSITEIRRKFSVGESERFGIIPARFVWEKGLIEFAEVIEKSMLDGWHLGILGDGPLRTEFEDIIKRKGLDSHFTILSSIPYADMPVCYAAADLFILPSRQDCNPLSVVEAIQSGLPVAVSCQAGNVDEAVTEGRNGWGLPVLDELEFRKKLYEVFSTPLDQLMVMGERSRKENGKFWQTKECVARFLNKFTGVSIAVLKGEEDARD